MGISSWMKLIVASLATIAFAGRGKDPWRVFGGYKHDGWCQAITDQELYQDPCSITIHVRQNDRTNKLPEMDDTYNQFMPKNIFDWNLQIPNKVVLEDLDNFEQKVYNANMNCDGKKKFFCIGSTEADGNSVFDHFRKACTYARIALDDKTGDDTCFVDSLEKLKQENRCNNHFYLGHFKEWEEECWISIV